VSFESRLWDVTIALDDVANDGGSDEHDDVRSDVEEAVGGRGNDLLVGTDEANVLDGAAGNDTLVGLLGADDLFGGGGFDLVSYSERGDAVTATLDGVPGDGGEGEDDWIALDVEDLEGGAGSDRLVGNEAENFLFGGAGSDQLDPLGGSDYVSGEAGNDSVALRDGVVDEVDCGSERDVVTADTDDQAAADCEAVDRPAAAPPPPPGPPQPQPPPPPSPPPPSPPPARPAPQPRPKPKAKAVKKYTVCHNRRTKKLTKKQLAAMRKQIAKSKKRPKPKLKMGACKKAKKKAKKKR
jgi:hypothetical protein